MAVKWPLVVLYGFVENNDSIIFLGRSAEIRLEAAGFAPDILKILTHCNGYYDIDEIHALTELSRDRFDTLLSVLIGQGIVVDRTQLYMAFHRDSANPMIFPSDISPQEIRDLVERRDVIPEHETYQLVPTSSALTELVRSRRSTREFEADCLSPEQLSGLLTSLYTVGQQRSTASAGQLYPLDIYITLLHDDQEPPNGLYRYDPLHQRLSRVANRPTPDQLAYLLNNRLAKTAAAVIFIAADFQRAAAKYSGRGYRYALIEVGQAAQNAALYCAEMGLGMVEIGGFQDECLSAFLSLPYPEKAVALSLIIGKPATNPSGQPNMSDQSWRIRNALVGPNKPIDSVVIAEVSHKGYAPPRFSVWAHYQHRNNGSNRVVKSRDCYGIGFSPILEEATIQAMAEAYERYASGLLQVDHIARAEDLNGEWFDPRIATPLQPFLTNQSWIDHFSPTQEIQWVTGNRWTSGIEVSVPVEHVYYPLRRSQIGRVPCYRCSSSGVATYTDRETASVRALQELIERDAIALTWYAKRSVARMSLNAMSQDIQLRAEHWLAHGWDIAFLDVSVDSLPVVLCLIYSELQYPALVAGASAAPTYTVACEKAWNEAELMALTWHKRRLRRQVVTEKIQSPIDHGKLYFRSENLERLNWLINAPEKPWQEPELTASELVAAALQRFDPIVIDLSEAHNPAGLHVVRVISERLLPISFGYGSEHYGHSRFRELGLEWQESLPSFPHFFA